MVEIIYKRDEENAMPSRIEGVHSKEERFEKLSVLIVDDDEFQRHFLMRVVKKHADVEVVQASDGNEALRIIEEAVADFNIIFSDLEMPNMDGMEFIRLLKEKGTASSLVITSSWDDSFLNSVHTMCSAYGLEPLAVLSKPLTSAAVGNVFDKVYEKISSPIPITSKSARKFTLEEVLTAVAESQIEPHFQAKYDIKNKKIVGAEALARWHHPELGIIAPFAFIDLLEKAGKIDDLTFMMIEKSAQYFKHLAKEGVDLELSVNLSLTSLADPKLSERIFKIVEATGFRADRMVLEVTESAAMTELAFALENLVRLRMKGFGLSIDDFGTGFASMQQLSRIPFTELKIDRSFVSTMHNKLQSRAIVESSIDIANRLGIKSVAEGVETDDELAALKLAGCNVAQGFLISIPLEFKTFSDFVKSGEVVYESQ